MKNEFTNLSPNVIEKVSAYFLQLQHNLCSRLEAQDNQQQFLEDLWTSSLGQGSSRILSHGAIFAKAGVNYSQISGKHLPPAASTQHPELIGAKFSALGVSIVIHPENPYVPTTHANVRFFIAQKENASPVWWFGGGYDLTPYYGFYEDCVHWHQTAYEACQPFGAHLYARFKVNCDHYFYLKHRQEARGIGGLFFDDLTEGGFENSFELIQSIGNSFIKAYEPIVQKRHTMPYGTREKQFQRYRRGRYVEFNLIYDRGTLFGLQSGGRTESILMSLPPEVNWEYNWQPEQGSPEEKLYTDFLPAQDWLAHYS